MFEAEKIIITDMCDRLILDTCGYFIIAVPIRNSVRKSIRS